MRKIKFLLLVTIIAVNTSAQKLIEQYTAQQGAIKIGDGPNDVFQYGERGFTLLLPTTNQSIRGVLISLDDQRFRADKIPVDRLIHPEANAKGLAVLYVSTGIPVDLYFNESSLQYVDSLLKTIFTSHELPADKIFLFGTMTAGHRALKYIEYCKKGKSLFAPGIKGVVVSESAIDWVRMWYEGQKQVRDKYNDVQVFEGNLITYLFKANFNDTPKSNMEKYLEFSPYSYFDTEMRKVKYYTDIAVRAYTFAPINYWFSANGKGVYDTNFPDMSGFINELKLAGNKQAELIVFTNHTRGKTDKMESQSDTWNRADKKELVDWILSKMENNKSQIKED